MMFSPEMAAKIINIIIAPAVMITAAAILLGGITQRYKLLDDFLQSHNPPQPPIQEIPFRQGLPQVDRMAHLLKHHHLLHHALIVIYFAILAFVVDMLAIALAELTGQIWLTQVVLFIFLLGISLLCGSLLIACREIVMAHRLIQLEMHQQCQLCHPRQGRKNSKRVIL
jgi:small-conductance mechanosensitive channel